jgi:hypothetical protein
VGFQRFQTMVIVALSAAIGGLSVVALIPTVAVGHGAGPFVSMGSNPVHSYGGNVPTSGVVDVMTATEGPFLIQDWMVTGAVGGTYCNSAVQLKVDGTVVAQARMVAGLRDYGRTHTPTVITHRFESGVPVPAGAALQITNQGSCTVDFTIAGRTVAP